MHGKSLCDFQREVTGGCKIENVTGISQANGFKRKVTGGCMIENVTAILQEIDFQRTLT